MKGQSGAPQRFKDGPEKTSKSDKYKAHDRCDLASLEAMVTTSLVMSFAENDQAHKGF
jgi:hypothetical protein